MMYQASTVPPIRVALATGLLITALFFALSGTANAANESPPPSDNGLASVKIAPPTPESQVIGQAEPSHADQSDNDLPTGAWVGIAVALALALLLLVGSLAYILPKPPQR